MSQENVDLVRSAYAAWNAGEKERFSDLLAEEVEYTTSGVFPDFDSVYRGRSEFLRFYDEMLAAWEYFRIDVREIETRGDVILCTLRFEGKGRSSGVEVGTDFFHGYRVENGRISYLASRATSEEALEAAVRSE